MDISWEKMVLKWAGLRATWAATVFSEMSGLLKF
jgi:hypothetical protein